MPTSPAAGPYAAHEWGLVAAAYRMSELRVVAGPRGVNPPGALGVRSTGHDVGVGLGRSFGVGAGGKPVLYFHFDDDTDALNIRVSVSPAGGGHVVEHFPPGGVDSNGEVWWSGVRVTRGACRGTFPTASDPACRTPDALCEAAELSLYETTDGDCLHVRDVAAGLLFYRTGPAEASLPLDIERGEGRTLTLTRASGAPAVAGWVMRIERGSRRTDTRVRVLRLSDGLPLEVPVASGADSIGGDEALPLLGAALLEAGLTVPERDAFIRAWADGLFGESPPAPGGAGDSGRPGDPSSRSGALGVGVSAGGPNGAGLLGASGRGGQIAPPSHPLGSAQDALLYVLPEASVNALLPLSMTPAPHTLRRAFVARVDVSMLGRVALREGTPSVEGPLPPEAVRRMLRRSRARFQRCLSSPHDEDGAASATLTLDLEIGQRGTVSEVRVSGAEISSFASACLSDALRAMAFPSAQASSRVHATLTVER